MTDIASTIQHVERLYESITGQPVPPSNEGAYDPIPPERDPQQYVDEQLERLARVLGPGFDATALQPAWVPAVSLWESADAWVFLIDVPGVARADLTLRMSSQAIEVRGTRPTPAVEGAGQLHPRWCERREGTFERTLALPTGASIEGVRAELRDGVLVVSLNRSERGAPPLREVDVR